MLKALRTNWIALASSLLFLAAIFYVLSQQQKISTILDVWRQIDRWYFALAAFLTLALIQTTSAWRLETIMSFDGVHEVHFRSLFRIQPISQFVAHGAPISAIADLARAAMIKLRYHLTPGRSIRLVFYERLYAAIGAVITGLLATIVPLVISSHTKIIYAQLLMWTGSLVGVFLLLAVGSFKLQTKIELVNRIVRAIVTLRDMLRRPLVATVLALVSVAQMLSFATVYFVLARSMQIDVPWWYILLYMPLIFFVSSLPVFYQGWGVEKQ
jgi:hypothetical protein